MGAGIRDVARLAGVAPSTVSRVLNDRLDGLQISAVTIDRIKHAATTLRYRPNAAARSLRTTRSQSIGVIARHLLHPFITELLRIISANCRARGHHLLLGHAEHSAAEGWILGDILSSDRVDGVLLLGDLLPTDEKRAHMEHLLQTHSHVVTVGAHPSIAGEVAILVDDAQGVSLAMEHVLSLGHHSIGYLSHTLGAESWEDRQRLSTYRQFLREHDLPQIAAAEATVGEHIESVTAELDRLMALPSPPTALLVNNDMTAVMAVRAALGRGIAIPDDLSIVGFDDIPFAALCSPGLTTIRQPIEQMGECAASILLDMIAGAKPAELLTGAAQETLTLQFAPTLVCRDSTRRHHA